MSPTPLSAIATLPTAWQEILNVLKKRGEARAEDLAETLGITLSGVRQHLTVLERDGLLQHREVRQGPGRPRHVYRLTPQADALYPRAYAELTNELLDYVEDADPDLVGRIFEKRAERRLQRAIARCAGRDFAARVRELAAILDEDGYLAEFEALPDGTYRITEHNCAVLGVAQRFGHACTSEIAFLRRALPEASVERVSHMIAGAHVCAYAIRPATKL